MKKGLVSATLVAALLSASGGAGAADGLPVGADVAAAAEATAGCGVGDATAHAKGVGLWDAGATSSAHVWPQEIRSDGVTKQEDNVATSDSVATGVGVGYAFAQAWAWGGNEWAHAEHACDLRPIYDMIDAAPLSQRAALVPTYGCAAVAGAPDAAYEGAVRVDAAGAAWLVGTVTRAGVASSFATPVGAGLALTAAHAASPAPLGLEETPLRFRATFTNVDGVASCQSALGA